MMYSVKESYLTIQGEGFHAGRVAVFCRFSGCNLWTGKERDRTSAICQFCDTDFVGTDGDGGGKFSTAELLADTINLKWPSGRDGKFVVFTGGEPLLQLNNELITALHSKGFIVAVETNGTVPLPGPIDWVCVSPKAGAKWVLHCGNELKLVYPQQNLLPCDLTGMDLQFQHYWLQPMDLKGKTAENTLKALDYCLGNPTWRLSIQSHKTIGVR